MSSVLGLMLILAMIYVFYIRKIIPSTVICAEWILFIVLGIFVYYNECTNYSGLVYILLCCLIYALCENIGYNSLIIKIKKNKSSFYNFDMGKAELLFACGIITDILLLFNTIKSRGYSFESIASILAVSSTTRELDIEGTILAKIGTVYALSVMGVEGYVTAYSQCNRIKRRNKFIFLFVGITLSGLFSTGKSIVIWALLIWISGWLTAINMYSFDYNQVWNYLRRNLKKILIGGVFFLGLMGLMMYMRTQRTVGKIVESMFLYIFGHIPVFSEWYYEIEDCNLQYSMGRQMFYGLFSRTSWDGGIAANFPLLAGGMVRSNIYTVFRSVIEDFGKNGGVVFWAIFGAISGNCRRRIERDKASCWAISLMMSMYFFIFMSFVISAWHYYATMLAFLLIWLQLIFIGKIRLKSKKE